MSNNIHEAETFMERLVFNNRLLVVAIFVVITIFLGWQASQIRPDTSFAKMKIGRAHV